MGDAIAERERSLQLEIAKQHRLLAQLHEQLAELQSPPPPKATAADVAGRVQRKLGAKR